jgi:hypothetical protein
VASLLETYTKCLVLLKGLNQSGSGPGAADGAATHHKSLRKSIRSDRSKVRRAYESRISQDGSSRIGKGDGEGFASQVDKPCLHL